MDFSVGRQLRCLGTASQFRLSVDHADLGSLVTLQAPTASVVAR